MRRPLGLYKFNSKCSVLTGSWIKLFGCFPAQSCFSWQKLYTCLRERSGTIPEVCQLLRRNSLYHNWLEVSPFQSSELPCTRQLKIASLVQGEWKIFCYGLARDWEGSEKFAAEAGGLGNDPEEGASVLWGLALPARQESRRGEEEGSERSETEGGTQEVSGVEEETVQVGTGQ